MTTESGAINLIRNIALGSFYAFFAVVFSLTLIAPWEGSAGTDTVAEANPGAPIAEAAAADDEREVDEPKAEPEAKDKPETEPEPKNEPVAVTAAAISSRARPHSPRTLRECGRHGILRYRD